jgi:hypothetical protein
MAQNPRIYYPIHAVGFARLGTELGVATGYRAAKGVQSAGLTTNFSLEQVYQLGQLSLYENIENLPEVEMTIEKVVDGYSLLQHLATPTATAATLAGRYNDNQCMVVMAFYSTSNDYAGGTPLSHVQLSGAFVSAINWNIPVEGNITESITLASRDKVWGYAPSGSPWASGAFRTTAFLGNDSPVTASGGVQRRENVLMGSGAGLSRWPTDIPGTDMSGFNPSGVGGFAAHIQNVTVALSLGRTDLLELGRKGPYFRFANFPVEVSTTIEITATEQGDFVNARQDQDNLSDETIFIALTNGVTIDLGTKNKLSSVSFTGGDTGGGNKTVSYTYTNFNDYTCKMGVTDPAAL